MKNHFTSIIITLIFALAVPAMAATPPDSIVVLDGFVSSSSATVRLLNASPDVGPVDLYVAQYREAENVGFEEISDAVDVSAANFLVRVFPAGETETPLIETGVIFAQGLEVTLVLTGMAEDLVLIEAVASRPGSSPSDSYVRFFHASPDAPAMDLAITGGDVLHTDVEFREASDYFTVVGDAYDFEIRKTGETAAFVSIPGVWLQGARFYTIYLTGLEADEGEGDEEYSFFVPGAVRAPGANASFFVTDLDLLNTDVAAVTYQFAWLPRDTDNATPMMSDEFTIEAGRAIRHKDVLGSVFGFDVDPAEGALSVISDSSKLSIFARIFNQSDEGTFGQAMPGIAFDDLIPAGTVKRVMFFTENDDFRSNLGMLNGTGSPITVKWRVVAADGTVISTPFADLPPWGNIQKNRIFAGFEPVEAGFVEIWSETHGAVFAAYGSVLDNVTSDPTTVLPQ